jgi:hypothetical protein
MKSVELNRRDNTGESPVVQPASGWRRLTKTARLTVFAMMTHKRRYELPDEVIAVLDCSPNLEP